MTFDIKIQNMRQLHCLVYHDNFCFRRCDVTCCVSSNQRQRPKSGRSTQTSERFCVRPSFPLHPLPLPLPLPLPFPPPLRKAWYSGYHEQGNQNRSRVSSFIRRRGIQKENIFGGCWKENWTVSACYSIATGAAVSFHFINPASFNL